MEIVCSVPQFPYTSVFAHLPPHFENAMIRKRLERRATGILLALLSVLAVFLVFKSSADPVIAPLKGTIAEGLLCQFENGNGIVFDVSIGYLVSALFYLIVVILPEKQKRRDIDPHVNAKVEELIFSLASLNREVIRISGKGYDYKNLSREQISDCCGVVDPREHKSKFHNGVKNIFEANFGYKCFNNWKRIESHIEEIFRFFLYIDTELISHLNKIRLSTMRLSVETLRDCDAFKNSDMAAYATDFYEVFVLTKNLRDYYVAERRAVFKNDPWS